MRYIVRRIKTQTAIESCERAGINEVQWNGRLQPEAWAYMGYLAVSYTHLTLPTT